LARFQRLLARLGNLAARPRRLATFVTRMHARVLRLSRGRMRRSLFLAGGQPVLVLTPADLHLGPRVGLRARFTSGAERDSLRERFRAQNAGADTTASLTSREIPVVVLEPEGRPERP
jgi:hypothetical protein